MPNLKDYIATDIHNVFFNVNEFAEEVMIDKLPMLVVEDDDQLQRYNLKSAAEGLALGKVLFYAKKADFEEAPFIDKSMVYDGKHYKVLEMKDNFGVCTIILGGYRS